MDEELPFGNRWSAVLDALRSGQFDPNGKNAQFPIGANQELDALGIAPQLSPMVKPIPTTSYTQSPSVPATPSMPATPPPYNPGAAPVQQPSTQSQVANNSNGAAGSEELSSTPSNYLTPSQAAALRAYSGQLLVGKGQQPVNHWAQGLSNMVGALLGGNMLKNTGMQDRNSDVYDASKVGQGVETLLKLIQAQKQAS